MPKMNYSKPQVIGSTGYKEKRAVVKELEEAHKFLTEEAGFILANSIDLISGYTNRTYYIEFKDVDDKTGYVVSPGFLITTTGSAFQAIYSIGRFDDNTTKKPFRNYQKMTEFTNLEDLKKYLLEG